MMGELWWNRLVNSVRFLDDVQDALLDSRSVVLHFDGEIPWLDIMTDTLGQRLAEMTDSRTFEVHDVSDAKSPGTYLFERFCSESERTKYWPTKHISHERFLAGNRETPLNSRFVCVTGLTSNNAAAWVKSVAEYLENCESPEESGIFILLVQEGGTAASKWLASFKYEDYVSDYDCMMLCLTLISSLSCSRAEKMYLCEVASNIAHNSAEHAGLLAAEKLELIRHPVQTAERVYQEHGIRVTKLRELVNMAVWEAQIKLVFPILENFRAALIRKYGAKLQLQLPIRSSNGEKVEAASDLEIGQLYYICKGTRIMEPSEFEMVKKMRDARNTLAHWNTLTYEQLKELKIL